MILFGVQLYVANDILFVVQFINTTLEMPIFGVAMVVLPRMLVRTITVRCLDTV